MAQPPYEAVPDVLKPGTTMSDIVRRVSDGAIIPADPRNVDWQAYRVWLKAGSRPTDAPAESAPATPAPAGTSPEA